MMKPILLWYLRLVLSRPVLGAVAWTKEERAVFDNYFRTSDGLKLFEFMRQTVAGATFNAVYQDKVSANARARGMQDILGIMHRLRVFPGLEEESASEPAVGWIDEGIPAARLEHFLGGSGAIGGSRWK